MIRSPARYRWTTAPANDDLQDYSDDDDDDDEEGKPPVLDTELAAQDILINRMDHIIGLTTKKFCSSYANFEYKITWEFSYNL